MELENRWKYFFWRTSQLVAMKHIPLNEFIHRIFIFSKISKNQPFGFFSRKHLPLKNSNCFAIHNLFTDMRRYQFTLSELCQNKLRSCTNNWSHALRTINSEWIKIARLQRLAKREWNNYLNSTVKRLALGPSVCSWPLRALKRPASAMFGSRCLRLLDRCEYYI